MGWGAGIAVFPLGREEKLQGREKSGNFICGKSGGTCHIHVSSSVHYSGFSETVSQITVVSSPSVCLTVHALLLSGDNNDDDMI